MNLFSLTQPDTGRAVKRNRESFFNTSPELEGGESEKKRSELHDGEDKGSLLLHCWTILIATIESNYPSPHEIAMHEKVKLCKDVVLSVSNHNSYSFKGILLRVKPLELSDQ